MNEPWKEECIAYEDIKKDIESRQKHHKWTQEDEKDLETVIRSEASRIDAFINRKEREIESRIAYCERMLTQKRLSSASSRETIRHDLKDILLDLNDLVKYTRYNFLMLQKLIKTHDESRPNYAHLLLLNITQSASLDVQRFDATLVKAFSLHELCYEEQQQKAKTASYWVHPDHLNELRAILLFHLPESKATKTSCLYIDNSEFSVYQQCLERDTDAESIYFRWVGNNDTISVERNARHVSDSFPLNVDKVDDFVSGVYSVDHYVADLRAKNTPQETLDAHYRLAAGVQASILEKQLKPVMRTYAERTVFELSYARLTLETDLTFVRETKDVGNVWHQPRIGSDTSQFPYALLQIECQTPIDHAWLTELLDSNQVYQVPCFSKHLHGIFLFWKSCLPLLPWWSSQMELDIRHGTQSISGNEVFTQCKNLKTSVDGKQRIGYLESTIEYMSRLQRSETKKASLVRSVSTRSTKMPNSSLRQSGNPFEDPIWAKQNDAYELPMFTLPDRPASSHDTLGSTKNSSVRIVHEHQDSSSTRLLVDEKTSSIKKTDKEEKYLDTYFGKDLEQGKQEEDDNEDKKKKKKKKDEGGGGAIVEPKTLFANERTFIHWLNFAATLLTTALTLMNFGDRINKIIGAIFFGIAFLFVFYSFGFNRWRAYRILYKPHLRFDDMYGPVFLCVLLVGALVLNFGLRWNAPMSTTSYLGTNATTSDTSA
ncbi:VTC domain-containing protein [Gilbertella persicaria]|uniref:VTC domain-containing protein n=1 Tax=Gilbertella persicaria TaxID=101096 RepID=UPI0022207BD5|nr:VTC domain-containing protein [Gilbertella persicaria]KAI8069866.1 VTC domain-containing protein [Gilbertella persicaria]